MAATIIDGNAIAAQVAEELRPRIAALQSRGVTPGLAFVLVGHNAASESYVRGKTKDSLTLGIISDTIRLPAEISLSSLLRRVDELNHDPRFHGLIVQMPLPNGLDEHAVTSAVAPTKDVDGLNPLNLGRLLRGDGELLPCTPAGVQQILLRSGNAPEGKHVVICGRSVLVGRSLAAILFQKAPSANATVTICHTGTPDLGAVTRSADILIAAAGRPRLIDASMVRAGACVIDVGVNRVADAERKSGSRLVGDVDFDSVAKVAGAITPVPGGVGPLTRMMLLANTVLAAEHAVSPQRQTVY